jgi:hypothetical protein
MKERGGIGPGSMKQENIAASRIEPIVERVVGQAMESHVASLRAEIVRRVMEEIAAEAATGVSTSQNQSNAADLAAAVAEIQLGSSQREILRALLDTSARYAVRAALFVVKGNHATGWQGRGFADNDAVRDFVLDENAPAVVRAIRDRVSASAPVSELDPRFIEKFESPASGEGHIFPLLLKDKVAALVYADGGVGGEAGVFETGALQVLVLSTSAWLEVNSLRKSAHKESSAAPAGGQHLDNQGFDNHDAPVAKSAAVTAPAPAFNDPFASHSPAFAAPQVMAAAAGVAGEASTSAVSAALDSPTVSAESANSATEAQFAVAEMEPEQAEPAEQAVTEPAVAEPFTEPMMHAEVSVAPEPLAAPALSPEDQYIHGKAQRFARLLVDEIKLYNQAKVGEGRKNKDLYDRLKEPIDKSRATYQKRYGTTVAASANYFQREIIRSLAEDDSSVMGANFRQ